MRLHTLVLADEVRQGPQPGLLAARGRWTNIDVYAPPTNDAGELVYGQDGRQIIAGLDGMVGILLTYEQDDAGGPHRLEVALYSDASEELLWSATATMPPLAAGSDVPVPVPLANPDGNPQLPLYDWGGHHVVVRVDGRELGRARFSVTRRA